MEAFANGIRIFYEKQGEGAPLILLHGNGETHEIFDKEMFIRDSGKGARKIRLLLGDTPRITAFRLVMFSKVDRIIILII